MQWINENTTALLAGLIVWIAIQGGLIAFTNKMNLKTTGLSLLSAYLVFQAVTSYAPDIIGQGFVNALAGVERNPITKVFNDMTGTSITTTEGETEQRASSQASSGTAAEASSASPGQTVTTQAAPEPIITYELAEDALLRWIRGHTLSGKVPTLRSVYNGSVQEDLIPKGVTCTLTPGADFMARAKSEIWPLACTYNGDEASTVVDGNWGRFWSPEETSVQIVGAGGWPDRSYNQIVTMPEPVAIEAEGTALGGLPANAPRQTGGLEAANAQQAETWDDKLQQAAAPTIDVDDGQVQRGPEIVPLTHTVAAGDSMSKIAARYFNDAKRWTDICKWNGLWPNKCNLLRTGQVLKLEQ